MIKNIPFCAQTDTTRLQMSIKQLNQVYVGPHLERPIVRTEYTSHSFLSKFADRDCTVKRIGNLVVVNDEEVYFLDEDINGIPIRFVNEGQVKKGDLLFEYEGFHNGYPVYGVNANIAFLPIFGFNYEDAIVISQSLADRLVYTKISRKLIPVYTDTVIKLPDKYKIKDEKVVIEYQTTDLSKPNLLNLIQASDIWIGRKLEIDPPCNVEIRVHKVSKSASNKVIAYIRDKIENLSSQWKNDLINNLQKVVSIIGTDNVRSYLRKILLTMDDIRINDLFPRRSKLAYVIEVVYSSQQPVRVGDKLSNRFANKGVVSLIIPDEIRPYYINDHGDKVYIDCFLNPLGVWSRMTLGQLWELLTGKFVLKAYQRNDFDKYLQICERLSPSYIVEEVKNSGEVRDHIVVTSYKNFNAKELLKFITSYVPIIDKVVYPKEFLQFIADEMRRYNDIDVFIPTNQDFEVEANVGPMYISRLKHTAESKLNVRSIGPYKLITNQPTRGKRHSGGSRIGYMEIDALIAHGCIDTIREFKTIKSDLVEAKLPLMSAMIKGQKIKIDNFKSKTQEVIEEYMQIIQEIY